MVNSPLYIFRLYLLVQIACYLTIYAWNLPHVLWGWRAWAMGALEVAVCVEAMMMPTWTLGYRQRSNLRLHLGGLAAIVIGFLVIAQPDAYPTADKTAYYVRLLSQSYGVGVLVAALVWGIGRKVLPGSLGHAGCLLVWFAAALATSHPRIRPWFWQADIVRQCVRLGCIAYWVKAS